MLRSFSPKGPASVIECATAIAREIHLEIACSTKSHFAARRSRHLRVFVLRTKYNPLERAGSARVILS